MMNLLRRNRRFISSFLVLVILFQVVYMPSTMALTSGPSQPEVQGFQPAGTSDMVDLFSGDFSYNIPLFELPGPNGGYPFNLAYQAGIGMDNEASWVGLGWSLTPGAINRQMRGLPDEFKGDKIYTKMAIEPSITVGLGAGVNFEVFGGDASIGTIGLGVTYNNFKGFGYSIDANVGYKMSTGSGMTAGVGLDLKLDSKEGVSAAPNLGLGNKTGSIGLSAAYNSKTGLDAVSMTSTVNREYKKQINPEQKKSASVGAGSASLSFAHPGYTPQVSLPMRNINIAARFAPGGSFWGIFAKGYIRGFYGEQWLKDNKKRVPSSAYGYLNYQNASGNDKAVMDFNREKDGIITKESPNLPIPSLTYDIYSVTGQGISAMYRPIRSDRAVIHDPEVASISVGGSIGVDVGPALSHVGVNLNLNHSKSISGLWSDRNNALGSSTFQHKNLGDDYEPTFFKVHGENTPQNISALNSIGGSSAVRVSLSGENAFATAENKLENKNWSKSIPNASTTDRDRNARAQVIQTITNEELLSNGQELISHLKVRYQTASGLDTAFNRTTLPAHHIAAFTALTPEGLRYNYGIPAYNLSQEEVQFSAIKELNLSKVRVKKKDGTPCASGDPCYDHSGTEKFLKRVELPKYAHSYLLTSIIGPDYVDVLGDGVTEDDLGYWVKFTYQKTADKNSPYRWRNPFSKADYQEGWKTDPRDDKGSFVYGEKEIWYLAKAETKSHVTTFTMEEREDARGVLEKLQDGNNTGKSLYALKEIKLYTRTAGATQPIKAVKFEYDYSLCQGVYNSNTNSGKLTLKKLWFEYGNSKRGALNPYLFKYDQSNPSYDQHAYDRWGNYKPFPAGDSLHNIDFPYAEQNPLLKQELDQRAAAWSLTEIKLPSGGKIQVDYESDDYGYVQHLPAMQMMEIVNPDNPSSSGEFELNDNAIIKFKLEKPINGSVTLSAPQMRAEVMKYLDQKRKQLYFKAKINIRSNSENFFEYISGYADIDFSPTAVMALHKEGSNYVYGSFQLVKEEGAHPFSLRAWQHVRTNQPELANSGKKLDPMSTSNSDNRLEQTNDTGKRVSQIKGLGNVFTQVRQMFEGFYKFCKKEGWGREVIAGKSWVRLNSPDKIKYGGGLRVRQITMKDNWSEDSDGLYGQVYEYTTEEGNSTISSGVAAYEPLIGGEENPFRYAKKFTQSVPLRSDNNMYFEFPVNESYFPGPQVGYSKVKVTSLAAAALAGMVLNGEAKNIFPKKGTGVSYGTSGATIHEFYTAKDFPVITDETEKHNKPFKLSVPIPFLGNISLSKLTTSQGYSIVTNDMHGKQKKVSTYRQDRQGKIEPDAISWVKYNYHAEPKIYQQEKVTALNAMFKDNGDGTLGIATKEELNNPSVSKFSIGQENEFFMDMRQHEDNTWEGGVSLNVDILTVGPFTIPTYVVWPSIGKSAQLLRSAVTNKIIFKSGILESTEAFDGGSRVITQNVKWDKHTGGVVLSRVNNNFDAPIYSYNIPAYTQYQGMGAAYQNIGLTFSLSDVEKSSANPTLYTFKSSIAVDKLYSGDEILLYAIEGGFTNPIANIVFAGEEDMENVLYSGVPLTSKSYKAMIVRSGYRNQLNVSAGSITGLQDPSKSGTNKTYSKAITIPVE
jgi:hypothetical protein